MLINTRINKRDNDKTEYKWNVNMAENGVNETIKPLIIEKQ